jgi:pSer/pThr/pTyr-binding forkhead associated (FHA) protein
MRTGEVKALMRCAVTIGRSPRNDVPIAGDQAVSRHHALIVEIQGNFYLEDIGSRNGTAVNGKQISTRTLLNAGDEISMGLTQLVFQGPSSCKAAADQKDTQDHSPAIRVGQQAGLSWTT